MLTRRLFIGFIVGLCATGALSAQSVNLTEAPLADRCVRNVLTMELDGKISVKQEGKDNAYPLKAKAKHEFMERFLDIRAGIADKVARHYTVAEGSISFNNNESSKRSLHVDHRFLVTQRVKDRIVTFSPKDALTREEIEITEHLDTMAVSGLLPGKIIEVGKSWAVPSHVVAALCELDGVTGHSLQGTLDALKGNIAHVTIAGKAEGINLGAQVAMTVNAQLEFDTKAERIVQLEWKEADTRQQGPVTPALSADVTIKLTRTPIEEPEQLNKFALVPVPTTETPPADLTTIKHEDAKKRFALSHARSWHVVSPEDSPQLVMRHLERGDFIAQVTITAWKKGDPKNVMKLDEFADLMAKTPGWAIDKESERAELKDPPKGHQKVYRVSASGELDGVRTVQSFYLVMSPQGDQLIVTFSVVPQHVQRLGARDLELVREIIFPEPSE